MIAAAATIGDVVSSNASSLVTGRTRPTAVIAGSDEVAIGTIVAARQLGIHVPAQLSVIGIDGHELAPMFRLTTLAQDPGAQGVSAVELVMVELDGERVPERGWHP